MLKTLLISLAFVAIAVVLLSVKLLVKKNGRFSSMHIHDSQPMKERGINCVIEQDRDAQRGGK